MMDIVIPIGPNDRKELLDKMIEQTQKNVIGYRNIYLVAYDPKIEYKGCITIPENNFPFNKETIASVIGHTDRLGWYLQQLIKLHAGFMIPGILNTYLVIDVDTVFMKPTRFMNEDGKPLYNTGDEYHPPYFDHMHNMHSSLKKVTQPSGICHHMVFQRNILEELFRLVENANSGEPFYRVFLKKIDPNHYKGAGASEYEIYFNYLHIYHPGEFVIRPLHWKNSDVLHYEEEYDYISYHWHKLQG